MILSADGDECCAETWKLVTDGSGDANSGGHSSGTGGIRHDELMESDFFMIPRDAMVSVNE